MVVTRPSANDGPVFLVDHPIRENYDTFEAYLRICPYSAFAALNRGTQWEEAKDRLQAVLITDIAATDARKREFYFSGTPEIEANLVQYLCAIGSPPRRIKPLGGSRTIHDIYGDVVYHNGAMEYIETDDLKIGFVNEGD
ncbi:hypothetical protein EIP91_001802 [Steccherinum ochraceum]|uniref:Uncharacterized protein n=1 Tax=Steccherinum ochraceum TaxID=92696 RepID=A0A4R0RPX2_9APHY|nr:hypothetical protein EIP91_001802 [Steccherinum ochraceum]